MEPQSRSVSEKKPRISSSYTSGAGQSRFASSYGSGSWDTEHISTKKPFSLNSADGWENEWNFSKENPFSSIPSDGWVGATKIPNKTSFVFSAGSGSGRDSAVKGNKDTPFVPEKSRRDGDVKVNQKDTPFVPEKGFYQPSSEETREAYQALVSLVESYSNSHPPAVLYSFVDEVLSVLKSSYTAPFEKKAKINECLKLKNLPDFLFNQMVTTAKLITDYHVDNPACESEMDFYQPKSEATIVPYTLLLDVVNSVYTCQQPQIVQCVIAHEVLKILKNSELEIARKREMIENSFLGAISDDSFETLLFSADVIDDFSNNDFFQSDYIHPPNPIQWRPEIAGFHFDQSDSGGGGGCSSDQLVEVEVKLITDDSVSPIPVGVFECNSEEEADLVYSSESDVELDAVYEVEGAENKEIDAVDEDEEAENKSDVDAKAEEAKFVYSDEEAEADASAATKLEEESHQLAGNKLEYSSEEELIYFDHDKARGSDKEDEDGWVKIDFDEEDGI